MRYCDMHAVTAPPCLFRRPRAVFAKRYVGDGAVPANKAVAPADSTPAEAARELPVAPLKKETLLADSSRPVLSGFDEVRS